MSVFGLSSSIGKTYCGKFAVINSRRFNYDEEWGRWEPVPFVNLGLLFGLKRSAGSGDTGKRFVGELGAIHRELMSQIPQKLRDEVNKSFFYYNKNTLKGFRGSWNLPEYLGGLGLDMPVSDTDRKIGSVVKMGCLKKEPVSWPVNADWQMHQLVQQKIKKRPVPFRRIAAATEMFPFGPIVEQGDRLIDDTYHEAYLALVVGLLFQTPLNKLRLDKRNKRKGQLFDIESMRQRALNHNGNLHASALKNLGDPRINPMTDLDLRPINKKLFIPLITCIG